MTQLSYRIWPMKNQLTSQYKVYSGIPNMI